MQLDLSDWWVTLSFFRAVAQKPKGCIKNLLHQLLSLGYINYLLSFKFNIHTPTQMITRQNGLVSAAHKRQVKIFCVTTTNITRWFKRVIRNSWGAAPTPSPVPSTVMLRQQGAWITGKFRAPHICSYPTPKLSKLPYSIHPGVSGTIQTAFDWK